MPSFYKNCLRNLLFRGDPEETHENILNFLHFCSKGLLLHALPKFKKADPVKLFGLNFRGPVGLAAGFDKNALCVPALERFGFGHVEVGTVTPRPQVGNPRVRIYRYIQEAALINAMGFPNQGAEIVAKNLAKLPRPSARNIPIGINIGKGRESSLEDSVTDYLRAYHALAEYADYITLNISSPNTPQLRKLQFGEKLWALLSTLVQADKARAEKLGVARIPLLIKIDPDMDFAQLDRLLELLLEAGINGIIATNTTLSRPTALQNTPYGGLSGQPLYRIALDKIKYIHEATAGKLPIIGTGGIHDAASASAMMDAGASLLQIYTGFIFEGPSLPSRLNKALIWRYRPWISEH